MVYHAWGIIIISVFSVIIFTVDILCAFNKTVTSGNRYKKSIKSKKI